MGKGRLKLATTHEQVILGTMLTSKLIRLRLLGTMTPGDFIAPRHRAIFAGLKEMNERGLDYVPATLSTFLPTDKDSWGGEEYLEELQKKGSNENLEHHVSRARWDVARSSIYRDMLGELEAVIKDPTAKMDEAHSIATRIANRIREASQDHSAFIQGAALTATYMAKLYAREGGQSVRTSGYMALDKKLTNPFAPGLCTVITAAPSIGKTTVALNMGRRQAKRWKVGYLAWESGTTAALDIITSAELEIPLATLVKRPERLTVRQRDDINALHTKLFEKGNNLSFLKRPPKHIFEEETQWTANDRVLDWVEAKLHEWDRDIIYWDLFEKKMANRRPDAISWALDRVQEIADTTHTHIVLLHQITFKEVEKQINKRPSRATLKGSGGYIEMPDVVLGLYRKAVYDQGVIDNELEMICLKQRIGPWPFRLIFDWHGNICQVKGGREIQLTIEDDEDEEI